MPRALVDGPEQSKIQVGQSSKHENAENNGLPFPSSEGSNSAKLA